MNKAILDKIDELQSIIHMIGKLDIELQKKINYKFRLDWNYYSNEMEGNSLTRIETRQLMMENVTIDGKPFKDVFEMRGHDKEVLEIMRIGKGEVRLSEKRIKDMHKAIMYETDPELEQMIGKWKTTNNHIINYRKEKFEFVDHSDVASAMHELLNQTNANIDAIKASKIDAMHPVELAFQFHLDYIRIHPFYDGNGRTARLLTNLLLISHGFPPLILKKENRDLYYKYLADIQGYGANPDLFLSFMGELLQQSQQLILDAIAGKDIEEEDDLDKKIALWKNELDHESEVIKKSNEVIVSIYRNSLNKLFDLFLEKTKQFDELFSDKELKLVYNNKIHVTSNCIDLLDEIIDSIDPLLIESEINSVEVAGISHINGIELNEIYRLGIYYSLIGFKKANLNTFSESIQLTAEFNEYNYRIQHQSGSKITELKTKLLSEQLTNDEIKTIIKETVQYYFENIKRSKNQ